LNVGVEEPEPEPLPPNQPPVAIIDGPTEVEVGQSFCLRSASYDTDGYLVYHDWGYYGEYSEYDEEGFTETTSSKCGLSYEDEGEQQVWLQVTDDGGKSDDTTHTINVVPPIPDADFEISGYPIENRAMWIEFDRPYGRNDVAERRYPIVESILTIRSHESDNQKEIVIVSGDLENIHYDEIVELMFRKAGTYDVTYKLKNNRGQTDSETQTVTIAEDMIPTAEVETAETYYLGSDKKETVTIFTETNSIDDRLGTYIYEIAYDTDNDNSFLDESYSTISKTGASEINYQVTKLGNYSVRLTVLEFF
ncbi:hypothetical protein D7X33_40255, partial [Butyricicoccus sp. 1XD8-22]